MLNGVVLSELRFGEPRGPLHDQGVSPLLNLINDHARGRLRRLVLAGDILVPSTPESVAEVRRQVQRCLQQRRSRIQGQGERSSGQTRPSAGPFARAPTAAARRDPPSG